MDLDAQRKRRAPVTYGKLFISRRKIPSSFGDGFDAFQHGGGDSLMGEESSSKNLQHSKLSSSKSLETGGSKLPEPQLKRTKSGPVPSRSIKHGLDRANSAPKGEVAEQKVFDVPSSDEDVPKLRPTIRRALSSSQKRFRSGRLEENRIPSTGRSERVPRDREEVKASPPMVTPGQAGSKTQSTDMRKPVNMKDGVKQTPKTSITKEADIYAAAPQKPMQSLVLEPSSTGQDRERRKSSLTSVSSAQTEEKQKAWVNPKGNERPELEDNPKMKGEPLSKWKPNTLKKSKDGGKSRAVEKSEVATGIPAVADFSLVQRRPRKQREPKSLPNKAEQQPPQGPAQPSVPKLHKTVARASQNKDPARLPLKSPTSVESLYISSPVLEIREPIEVPTESLVTPSSLWDEIMEGRESEDQPIARKPKRSRESGSSEGEIERGSTPPRRRRLIDTLEVDWTVCRPKQRILEAEMDVDSDIASVDDTSMITLAESQPLTDSQNTDEVEDVAQAFQRGVGAIQSAPTLLQRNKKVTYARQRSFLAEEVKEGGDPFADPLLLPVRDFGRGLRKAPLVEEDDDEDHGPGMMKSLHELREAGVNKRFLDIVEGYFEDIERGFSIGQKRVGYIELATKLRDKTFLQKFRANNFERRLLKDFEKQDDEIVQFILCFIVWSFLDEDTSSQILQLVHKKGIITMIDSMLDSTRDMKIIVKDKKTNMTKAAQSLLLEFCDIIRSSKIFGGKAPKALSPQILALAVLDLVMKGLRRSGFMGDYLSVSMLKKLVRVLEPFQMTADLEKRKQADPLFVELPVSILESYSIGRDSTQDIRFPEQDLDVLANIVPGVMQLEANDFQPIQLLILRLHINLTNHRPDICDKFGKLAVIRALVSTAYSTFEALSGPLEGEARLIQLDMLVLSLALMINFAEMSDAAGLSFIEVDSYATSQLAVLLKLFLGRMELAGEADSMEETQSNVAFGYLSILLGNLCRNTTVRNVVRSQMPKKNLEPLVNAVQEFVSHNQKVDEERIAITGGEGETWNTGFTERLEQVAIRLKAAEGYS
ncbi:hypothetical protein L211DRAFT_836749 [Terfezia boudieri ATCC MYA-4762]|uniref:Wings apart-like protein C-terminal domain-containing protein n=1 Tax=Terfezia boudieri ATCC MYA-4762 TaxID=1051890 RepID=A0A3N4LR46_9PEZI|nr:hypothetical protein L211DRAFT_836749 [Terfezia boudieri ATCC MYA-4762]